jgi:hypothetical protein
MFIPVWVLAPLLIVLAVMLGTWIGKKFFPWWDGKR